MVEAVFQHAVALPNQRRHRAEIGHIAGGEQQRAGPSGKLGQGFFKLVMWRAVTDHQVRSAAAHAPFLGAGAPGFDHFWMIGQTEVVVGTEGQ